MDVPIRLYTGCITGRRSAMASRDIHIIGAGPVGLATALLLAAQNRRVIYMRPRIIFLAATQIAIP